MSMVSVIVPVYNVEEYLPDCLACLKQQTYKDLEILLIDDGSPDESGRICDEAQKENPLIRVIHQENKGLSGARNTGLDRMRGDYVFFLDSDDTILPETIEKMMAYTKEHQIVCCGIEVVDPEKGNYPLTPKGSGSYNSREATDSMLFDAKVNSSSWAKIYKKDLFDQIRFPEGKIHEDEFITYRLLDLAERVYYTDELLYRYLKRPGSITDVNYSEKNLARFEAYAERALFFREKGYTREYEFTIVRIIDEAYHVVRAHKEYRETIRKMTEKLELSCLSFKVYPLSRLVRYEIKRLITL